MLRRTRSKAPDLNIFVSHTAMEGTGSTRYTSPGLKKSPIKMAAPLKEERRKVALISGITGQVRFVWDSMGGCIS